MALAMIFEGIDQFVGNLSQGVDESGRFLRCSRYGADQGSDNHPDNDFQVMWSRAERWERSSSWRRFADLEFHSGVGSAVAGLPLRGTNRDVLAYAELLHCGKNLAQMAPQKLLCLGAAPVGDGFDNRCVL